jgi:hypothetical protein
MYNIYNVTDGLDESLVEVMNAYQRFEDIPQKLRNDDHLIGWLRTQNGRLDQIPLPMVTDIMRSISIRFTVSLSSLRYTDTPNYREIALGTLEEWPGLIVEVDEEAISEDFVFKAVCYQGRALRIMLENWSDRYLEVISQRVMDEGLSQSLDFAEKIRKNHYSIPKSIRDMVTDEQVSRALVDSTYEIHALQAMDKLHLLTQAINNGYWPSLKDNTFRITMPSKFRDQKPSLAEAIVERSRDFTDDEYSSDFHSDCLRLFFTAYIKTFPISKVVANATTPAHIRMLGDIYNSTELKPYLSQFPELKSVLLESAMGL